MGQSRSEGLFFFGGLRVRGFLFFCLRAFFVVVLGVQGFFPCFFFLRAFVCGSGVQGFLFLRAVLWV